MLIYTDIISLYFIPFEQAFNASGGSHWSKLWNRLKSSISRKTLAWLLWWKFSELYTNNCWKGNIRTTWCIKIPWAFKDVPLNDIFKLTTLYKKVKLCRLRALLRNSHLLFVNVVDARRSFSKGMQCSKYLVFTSSLNS